MLGFIYKGKYFNRYTTTEILDKVCEFQFLPTDIILATYPRSGTTFTQEIIWQIKNIKSITNGEQVDVTKAKFPFLEIDTTIMPGIPNHMENLQSQTKNAYRFIKTHVPYALIKNNVEQVNPKIIVVMRNVKDCLVSNFHFESNVPRNTFHGTFEEFFEKFINGRLGSGDYFDNNLEWWALRKQENVLMLFYEDILINLRENVEKIANFLGDKLADGELKQIVHNCSFSTMYKDSNINFKFNDNFTYLRKGIVGDWKEHINEEQNEILNELIEKKLSKFDLKFIYE